MVSCHSQQPEKNAFIEVVRCDEEVCAILTVF